MKHKNKDGISLNYTSDDIHARLVKEVILEAIDMLEEGRHYDCKEFLKENFDIVEVEDFVGKVRWSKSQSKFISDDGGDKENV